MKQRDIIYSIQWLSAFIFVYCAYSIYNLEKSFIYDGARKTNIRLWLTFEFLTYGVGQFFLGLSAMEAYSAKYKYFEWNSSGHVAWIAFVGTSISRLMISAIINDIASDIRYMVITAAGLWLVIGVFVKESKPRKILPALHVLSTTAYLAFTFYLQYQNSAKAFYSFLSQVLYFLLLAPGSSVLNIAFLEAMNIGIWLVFFNNAAQILHM